MGSLNPFLWKMRTHLFFMVNTRAADGMATEGAGASTAIVLTQFYQKFSSRKVNSLTPGNSDTIGFDDYTDLL